MQLFVNRTEHAQHIMMPHALQGSSRVTLRQQSHMSCSGSLALIGLGGGAPQAETMAMGTASLRMPKCCECQRQLHFSCS